MLEKTKAKVTKFLGLGVLEDMEIAMHLIVSSADTRHSVVSQAETEIRKFSGMFDWNDPGLVGQIYSLFLGTLTLKDKPPLRAELKRVPSNTRIRLRLMPYLLKSREAATQFPACIQVHNLIRWFLTQGKQKMPKPLCMISEGKNNLFLFS